MNKERLLNVAKALREAARPDRFTMRDLVHPCGTPACALGHYASRGDLQTVFVILEDKDDGVYYMDATDKNLGIFGTELEHFEISDEQEHELFSAFGCGNANTAIEAAEYIERFVEQS